ncbi:hypothetical protein H6504_04620 [Candidatus Woesearchaeota archaeon]|nr:hypothetical protein [Candidatus Woesearchaeota archaeon]
MSVINPYDESEEKVNLYAAIWMIHDTALPNFKDLLGISLHNSTEARRAFAQKSAEADKRKYGNTVPDSYYSLRKSDKTHELNAFVTVQARTELTDFIQIESLGREVGGVFLTVPTVVLLPRMGYITSGGSFIETLAEQYKDQYKHGLMTPKRFFNEVSEDTRLWYNAQN